MAGGGVWALEPVAARAMGRARSAKYRCMGEFSSTHWERQAGDLERLVHARDLSARAYWTALVHLAGAIGRVVAPVSVGVGCAKPLAEKHRAGRQLEDPSIVGRRVSKSGRRVDRIAEDLLNVALPGDGDDGVTLVGRVPDIARAVQCDSVGALEEGMRNEDVVEAKGILRKRRVAAGAALQLAVAMELDPPERAARRVCYEEVALGSESEAVRHKRLRIGCRRAGLQGPIRPPDSRGIGHRLNPERF